MRLETGLALQTVDIAIEACQEVQGEPQIDNGRGGAFRPSCFFARRGLLATRRWGARVGATGPSWRCSHAVFLLRKCDHLPYLTYTIIRPIFVVYNSSDPLYVLSVSTL